MAKNGLLSGQPPSAPDQLRGFLAGDRLCELAADAARDLIAEGESQNTVRSYQTALRYWDAWFGLRYGTAIALPVSVPVVVQFIVDHAERTTKSGLSTELPAPIDQALVAGRFKAALGPPALATLVQRISVLSKLHQLKRLANPCRDAVVRELLAKTRRAYVKRGVRPNKKPALTLDPLTALVATCDESLRGIRDRALLLFAWSSGGRRRSEVTAATCEDLTSVEPGVYTFTLRRSKTNQSGRDTGDDVKPVTGQAGAALEAWLARSRISSGAVFRRVRSGGVVGEPLSPSAVRRIVKARASLAGLGDEFSAHSLRSGFVTEAARQQVPIGETMAMTGHTSVATVMGYFRASSSLLSKGARLLERDSQ